MVCRKSRIEIDHELRTINAQVKTLQRREEELARILKDMYLLHASIQAENRSLLQQRIQLEFQKQPINWLPSELLCRIFFHVIWQDPVNDGDPQFSEQRNTIYPDAITLSHVCSRWRQVALSTSRLWAYISYRTRRWCPKALSLLLERAGTSPIDLAYSVRPRDVRAKEDAREEVLTGKQLLRAIIRPYSHRLRSLHLTFHEMAGVDAVTTTLSSLDFPMLQQLELSVPPKNRRHFRSETSTLNFLEHSTTSRFDSLTDMRVQGVPLRCFSRYTLVNLRTLELSFPAQGSSLPTEELTRFLAYASQLEDLTLDNVRHDGKHLPTAPSSTTSDADSLPNTTLPLLQRLTWHDASAAHVRTLMSSLHTPRLKSWDLTVLPEPNFGVALARADWLAIRPAPTSDPLEGVHTLSALTDLTVQCNDGEALERVLHAFAFPALERLELGFLDPISAAGAGAKLGLPRVESLFRDPRLATLTHLTLSDFAFKGGRGYARAMGGHGYECEMEYEDGAMLQYMPGLVSLTLVACASAGVLLHELARTCPGGGFSNTCAAQGQGITVRACPKLEEMTLMSCQDVAFEDICRIAHLRSGQLRTGPSANVNGNVPALPTFGTCLAGSWPLDSNAVAPAAVGNAPPPLNLSVQAQRKVIPLRRSMHTNRAPMGGFSTTSMMIPSMAMAPHPAKLERVYIDDCPLVTRRDVEALEDMGVIVSYS
ncbi:hypothetical protein CONPUDRAFT_158560 [Coniophora puteana RWD-64-598 SS2]|uniref:Uncharacterized protein n=1 Tax=Coniophora puteana (strain RWD-64-598) TaxID=741705 RepID=A0A5M3M974_CONPW|nr:uncharacterized protein CONPUDRAFT_158560 [Coniophora puteana RWD-64-598 SS2]EIW75768.1 hypothetical protein CONPUDRAFT_158560 [Coniophora puteana RWD-64-598 SS2]